MTAGSGTPSVITFVIFDHRHIGALSCRFTVNKTNENFKLFIRGNGLLLFS